MRQMLKSSIAIAIAFLAMGRPSYAAFITFDELSDGDVVANQYAGLGVVFSSTAGHEIRVITAPAFNGSKPNLICTGVVAGYLDCSNEVILNFATAVDGLTFDGLANDNSIGSSFATLDVFQNFQLTHTFALLVSQGHLNPDHQDLSAYSGITEIRIYNNTDQGGTAYDNFSFAETPEPATFGLAGIAVLALAAARKRLLG